MSESVKRLSAVALRFPYRIEVTWDQITHPDFKGIKIMWWRIGDPITQSAGRLLCSSQYFIDATPGDTYVVAIRAHYMEAFYLPSPWVSVVVEVPWIEDEPQYPDLGQVTVIDTPRGPAILLDELWEACGQ